MITISTALFALALLIATLTMIFGWWARSDPPGRYVGFGTIVAVVLIALGLVLDSGLVKGA